MISNHLEHWARLSLLERNNLKSHVALEDADRSVSLQGRPGPVQILYIVKRFNLCFARIKRSHEEQQAKIYSTNLYMYIYKKQSHFRPFRCLETPDATQGNGQRVEPMKGVEDLHHFLQSPSSLAQHPYFLYYPQGVDRPRSTHLPVRQASFCLHPSEQAPRA